MRKATTYLIALDYNEVYSTYSNLAVDESILSSREPFEGKVIIRDEQVLITLSNGDIVLVPTNWILWIAPILPEMEEKDE